MPAAAAAAARNSASLAVPKAQGTAPASRTWRASRRVSTPVSAGTPWRTRKGSSASVERQFEEIVRQVAHHDAPAVHGRRRLVVRGVGAVVADVGAGERDDLPGVGRVGDHLLVAAHGGVEDELADGDRHRRARGLAGEDGPVGRDQQGGRPVPLPPGVAAHRCAVASMTTGSPRSTVWRTAPGSVRPA